MFTAIVGAITAAAATAGAIGSAVSSANQQALTEEQWEKSFEYQKEQDLINRQIHQNEYVDTQNFNKYMLERSNQLQIEQWQRENNYNAPAAQVERLRKAGINPIGQVAGVTNGNAGSASVANPVSGPQPAALNPMNAPGLPHYNPMQFGNLAGDMIDAFNAITNSKRSASDIDLSKAKILEVRANTNAIEKGNVRADDLHIYQLEDAYVQLQKHRSDKEYTDALTQNLFVRREQMLIESQKTIGDTITSLSSSLNQRLGNEIASKKLQLEAQKLQADIKQMSFNDRLQLALAIRDKQIKFDGSSNTYYVEGKVRGGWNHSSGFKFGNLKSSYSNTPGSNGSSQSSSDGIENTRGFSIGGEVGGSYTDGESENTTVEVHKLLQEDILPMMLQISFLEDDMVHYSHPKFWEAFKGLSEYTNTVVAPSIKNFLELQRQFEVVSSSVTNPINSSTYEE